MPIRFYLRRVRLNGQGYDDSGRYFGKGMPLYYFESAIDDHHGSGYIRAYDRADAKRRVMDQFLYAMFFN